MSGNSIYVVKMGSQRVTLPDSKSATDLMFALNVLNCFEPVSKQIINGNRQDLELYEVTFLDKAVKLVGLNDAELVSHWMLFYGCKKVGIEKLESAGDEE